jgi:hypothetical protein
MSTVSCCEFLIDTCLHLKFVNWTELQSSMFIDSAWQKTGKNSMCFFFSLMAFFCCKIWNETKIVYANAMDEDSSLHFPVIPRNARVYRCFFFSITKSLSQRACIACVKSCVLEGCQIWLGARTTDRH